MPNFTALPGSPLIPPELITGYLVIFLILLTTSYFFIHKHFKPEKLHHHIRLLFITTITLKLAIISTSAAVLAYTLIPQPKVTNTTQTSSVRTPITITFNRPLSRNTLTKQISPATPGYWEFSDPVYTTHLYRSITFYPSFTLDPNTTYTISLGNITNFAQISQKYSYDYSFTTQSAPKITNITAPSPNDHEITQPITIHLSKQNHHISQFDYQITPKLELEVISDHSDTFYLLKPKTSFQQGTDYTLTIYQTNLTWDLTSNQISHRDQTSQAKEFKFSTKPSPGIAHISPQGDHNLPNTPITISFTQPMNPESVQKHLTITPEINATYTWSDPKNLTVSPSSLSTDTNYTISLSSGAQTQGAGFLETDTSRTFKTIGPITVEKSFPAHSWKAVDPTSPITITFDQPPTQESITSKFSITPSIPGKTSLSNNTLTFTPESNLDYNTSYSISISPGVENNFGLKTTNTYQATFTTQNSTTILAIPTYYQKYSLSCEVAALKMALGYRNIDVSEDHLLSQVGYDPTPHYGNTWGDPHQAFVGNVKGKQMYNGYGVYWEPIAKVANLYRQASSFQAASITDLTQNIIDDNPVILWVYSRNGTPTHWFTPEGKKIYAASGEHAVVASGFVGPSSNPSHIIINDPLAGQVYWPRSLFDNKWNTFNQSGVTLL